MSAPKQPLNNRGKLRIRFTHHGNRFTLSNLGDYDNPIAYKQAQLICDKINIDIVTGNFTCSNNGELTLKYCPSAIAQVLKIDKKYKKEEITINKNDMQNIIKILETRLSEKYHSTDKSLLKFIKENNDVKITSEEDAKNFINLLKTKKNLQNTTVQRYLNTLKQCSEYFNNVKIKNKNHTLITPFTIDEINLILKWFEKTHYYNYVYFAIHTGMRPSEIIGLTWNKIDFNRRQITIDSVLARNNDNTSHRKRKKPKADICRIFPINNNLYNFLQELYKKRKNDNLVFLSPHGKNIDDHNFSNREWKKCLEECGIKHIDFYNCRRTFISHFLEKTKDVVKCASLTHGTKSGIKTIYEHYAGIINKIEVPDLF